MVIGQWVGKVKEWLALSKVEGASVIGDRRRLRCTCRLSLVTRHSSRITLHSAAAASPCWR
ncbi:hypothetical protein NITMOv2_2108 [Nitrospira moscoviensis]|uniref:Uncharacterized protein n=1 Tax=Nitrospira moscoviensis TaxID=42253 RepID=A0A0K2GC45_NITMO|nr:hypothetical protein NITMOv2_2108 [Nitrospira moscoviensis]